MRLSKLSDYFSKIKIARVGRMSAPWRLRLFFIALLCASSVLTGQSARVARSQLQLELRNLETVAQDITQELAVRFNTSQVTRFREDLRNSSRGMFVVLEDDSSSLLSEFRKLMQEEDLAEFRLYIRTVRDNDRQTDLVNYLRERYSWDSGPRWAFIAPDERCLAQGVAPPDAQALADQLSQAGIESPVRQLRAFVRRYPENLDGKMTLLRTLRSIAEERTRGVLGAEPRGRSEGRFESRPSSRLFEQAEIMASKEKPVALSAEDDLRIWVRWADEFDKLMAAGQWLESDFSFNWNDDFLDAHSPIVQGVYRKHIRQVEDALRRWPGSERIWGVWLHMSLVLGDRSARAFVNTLAPMPDTIPGTWPPHEAKLVLIQEARRDGNWRDVRDLLWDSWMQISQVLSTPMRRLIPSGGGNQNMFISRALESQWQQTMDPLIESLLRMGDVAGADSIVTQVKETSGWEEVSDLAATIAIRCEMPQVAARWRQ